MSKSANFQTLGPKGPQKPSQLTYVPKCWQHISNKICSFPKQKPSKLHIFSKCWQHITNKNIHPQSVGIKYPIFLIIFFENVNNFANFDIADV